MIRLGARRNLSICRYQLIEQRLVLIGQREQLCFRRGVQVSLGYLRFELGHRIVQTGDVFLLAAER